MDRYHCQMLARVQAALQRAVDMVEYWQGKERQAKKALAIWQKIACGDDSVCKEDFKTIYRGLNDANNLRKT